MVAICVCAVEARKANSDPKKNVRFLISGPPNVPPNSLRRKTGIVF